ncbi:hypothetical protein D3C81_1255010 [compost metagenome]
MHPSAFTAEQQAAIQFALVLPKPRLPQHVGIAHAPACVQLRLRLPVTAAVLRHAGRRIGAGLAERKPEHAITCDRRFTAHHPAAHIVVTAEVAALPATTQRARPGAALQRTGRRIGKLRRERTTVHVDAVERHRRCRRMRLA